jgi:hypothetical protein
MAYVTKINEVAELPSHFKGFDGSFLELPTAQ